MEKIKKIIEIIEEFAPLSLQEKWDNCGYQVCMDDNHEVSEILLALDPTERVVDYAIEKNIKLIVTHHPLTIEGFKRITPNSQEGRIVLKLIQNNITLYSSHTATDSAEGGINDYLANKLGLQNTEPLTESGLGRVGDLPQIMNGEEFAEQLKKLFNLKLIRTNATKQNKIYRVALCGGSGASLIDLAHQKAADTYICGDLKYHTYQQNNLPKLYDIGHFESENQFISIINDVISEKIPNFAIHSINSNYTTIL